MRLTFDEVRDALRTHWGLDLIRGGEGGDGDRDGRWCVSCSRTGYVVYGQFPRGGFGYRRSSTLRSIVESFDLAESVERARVGMKRRASRVTPRDD